MNKPVEPSIGIAIAWAAYEEHCQKHGRKPNPLRFGKHFANLYGNINWEPPEPNIPF